MSTGTPPNPYFNNINFNPSFFSVISGYLTEAIANSKYLKLIGGTLSGFLGINRTPRVELDVNGKAVINNGLIAPPAIGQFGGNGAKLILFDGNVSNTPFALGVDAGTLWYTTDNTGSHKFYTGTTERMRIKGDGYVGIGASDPLSRLTINATPGQVGTGGTIFGLTPLTITNPNPTSGSTLNDPKPVLNLCRDGTGAASFASRATFNLCRYENSGVNSRTRLDIGLTHADNFTETNVMSIRSDGNVGIGITNPSVKLYVNGGTTTLGTLTSKNGTYELFIDSPTSTTAASIQTIQQGVGYNQNLTLQAINGNVGIGTNDPSTYKLSVNGTALISNQLTISTATGTNPLYITSANSSANNCILIKNNSTNVAYMGIGGTTFGGNYANNYFIEAAVSTSLILNVNAGSYETPRFIIKHPSGNVGIATTNPNNILQVGNGGRLRISNGTTDYTLIGTKETDDTNNTSICLSAYTRAGFNGRIEYNSTTGGGHLFNINNNRVIEVFNTGINITRSITTYGANYYSTGTYIAKSNKVKSGSLITYYGFFLDAANFSNCMVHLSASHSSPNYTFWHGRVVYNNVNIVVNLASYAASNMTVEEFIENGTNLKYIIIYPTIAYTNETNVRINFYS